MRNIAFGGLLLLAGICVLLWLTVVGMFQAFAGGVPPLSVGELHDRPFVIGLIYVLPLFAVVLGALAVRSWKKSANAQD